MPKIATCCYCGTRAALVMRGEGRHELSCAACGAPLHEMKAMPMPHRTAPERETRTIYPAYEARRHKQKKPRPPKDSDSPRNRPKRKKSRGRMMRKVIEEIWDTVEDIFD